MISQVIIEGDSAFIYSYEWSCNELSTPRVNVYFLDFRYYI